jgi:hypothetical protein
MPVYSGPHPQYKADQSKPLGCALADIWLTRGVNVTDRDFKRQVDWGYPSTVPESYVIEKLQHLADTEVPAVRESACQQLFYLRRTCAEPNRK